MLAISRVACMGVKHTLHARCWSFDTNIDMSYAGESQLALDNRESEQDRKCNMNIS